MNGWTEVCLAVIAVATLAIAVAQVGVLVAAGRLARRLDRLVDQIEQELKPAFGHLNAIGRDASRAVALATAQIDRADRLFGDLARRVDETMTVVQSGIMAPARQGKAFLAGLHAALEVLREARRGRSRGRADDEDALFI